MKIFVYICIEQNNKKDMKITENVLKQLKKGRIYHIKPTEINDVYQDEIYSFLVTDIYDNVVYGFISPENSTKFYATALETRKGWLTYGCWNLLDTKEKVY